MTTADIPPYLSHTYRAFGNLTDADYAMLDWAAANLPAGEKILVAPGSAAQFLPAYDPQLVTVYPVLVRGVSTNASYHLVVDELTNGTLDRRGIVALEVLDIEFVAVTQQNSVLWRPFSPWPLYNASAASPLFHQGDAWVFEWGFVST